MRTLKIAVQTKIYSADQLYDYLVPENLNFLQPGCRVFVPFGKGNRLVEGIALEEGHGEDIARLKSIQTAIDLEPVLSKSLCALVKFLKERTFCTYYDALCAMLPTGLRIELMEHLRIREGSKLNENEQEIADIIKKASGKNLESILGKMTVEQTKLLRSMENENKVVRENTAKNRASDASIRVASLAVDHEEVARYLSQGGSTVRKHEKVLDLLMDGNSLPVTEICYFAGVTESVIRTLEKRGMIVTEEEEILRSPFADQQTPDEFIENIDLTEEQTIALSGLSKLMNASEPQAALLYGVTGSGKTLCYLALCDEALSKNKGVILLVPEIALTPQLVQRFYARYGEKTAVLHSALSVGERYDEWKRIRRGEAKIVIGTRSAVFAPVDNLGAIILDEEQENTYQSETSPRYHTRDVAKFRAAKETCLVLMGSATPDIETYYAAKKGKYHYFEISERFNGQAPPKPIICDLREKLEAGSGAIIGNGLLKELEITLQRGEQAILFLNRRGYNTHIGCGKCGYVSTCPHCSVSLTYHSANHLMMCHYCGYMEEVASACPSCKNGRLRHFGFGTQKVAEEVQRLFPKARILRMDADTTSHKNSHEKYLKAFREGEYDIMIGTQMVAKGLDIERVTLAAVVFADTMLYLDDFRAGERAFSMLTQVIGRSGRGAQSGRALIQTYTPESRILACVCEKDYKKFIEEELHFRHVMQFPPFWDIYRLSFFAENEEEARFAAENVCKWLAIRFRQKEISGITLFPAAPAPISRIGGKYRYRILIKCHDSKELRGVFSEELSAFFKKSAFKRVTQTIDKNPVSML